MALQVREQMHAAKDALQRLGPAKSTNSQPAAAVQLVSMEAADDLDDSSVCIICLDEPADMIFQPCSHCITCAACADLVMKAQKTCPVCRSPVLSVQHHQE